MDASEDGGHNALNSVREEGEQKKKPVVWNKIKKEKNRGQSQSVNNTSTENANVQKSVDYLKDLRFKREQDEKDGIVKKRTNDAQIERCMNDPNLNDYERLEMVRRRAEQME